MKGTKILREHNKRQVLSMVRRLKRTTRQDLVTQMNVSKNTISLIVEELIQENIIKEVGVNNPGKKGRPKRIIELNRNGYKAIGIAIEKEYIEYTVINYYGDTLEKEKIYFDCTETVTTKKKISDILKKLVKKYDHLLGAGISIPGIVNADEMIVYKSVRLGWENISMCELSSIDIPVFIQNSVNMSALYAVDKDGYDGDGSFYYIHVGTGVGGAYIVDHQIMNGASWTAGEIGHISVDPQGERCSCGQRGCLEQLISLTTFKQKLRKGDHNFDSIDNILKEVPYDQEISKMIYRFGQFLGRAIIPVIHLLNPNQIIVDSPYLKFDEFSSGCISYIQKNALRIPFEKTKITFGKSTYSKSIGAGLYAIINYETGIE